MLIKKSNPELEKVLRTVPKVLSYISQLAFLSGKFISWFAHDICFLIGVPVREVPDERSWFFRDYE
jgi:hypothetical protein